MINILNEEWKRYKFLIITDEEGYLLGTKVVKTDLPFNDLQDAISVGKSIDCMKCNAEATSNLCENCKTQETKKILKLLVESRMIEDVEGPVGLIVYRGLKI